MQNLEIHKKVLNLKDGFFTIEFSNGECLQCSLNQFPDAMGEYFVDNSISINNNDFNSEELSPINDWALNIFGEEVVILFLIHEAQKSGLHLTRF